MTTSLPRLMPPSTRTGTRPSTASTTPGKRLERGDRAVELAPAMVRHDDAVDASCERLTGVLRMQDSLQKKRPLHQRLSASTSRQEREGSRSEGMRWASVFKSVAPGRST